jgi:vacuolar-type H+-ATPase subunit F/Vma7
MPEEKTSKKKSSVAFLGSESAALAFRAMGFDTFTVKDATAAKRIWGKIAEAGYSAIFISEGLAEEMKSLLEPYYLKPLPAVILMPERQPGTGLAAERIRRATIKAVGAEI